MILNLQKPESIAFANELAVYEYVQQINSAVIEITASQALASQLYHSYQEYGILFPAGVTVKFYANEQRELIGTVKGSGERKYRMSQDVVRWMNMGRFSKNMEQLKQFHQDSEEPSCVARWVTNFLQYCFGNKENSSSHPHQP